MKFDNLKRNIRRVNGKEGRALRATIVLGLLVNTNAIITNSLSLRGHPKAAAIYGIAAGVVTFLFFLFQLDLFADLPGVEAQLRN